MAAAEFLHVDKDYPDGTRALRDLNLALDDGEMLVLVGPSGCGKSTALRLLAGLDPVSAGEIRIGGQRVDGRSPQQRDVAMVFQNYALYPHMTVRRNLEFPLRMMRLAKPEIRARVAETAGLLGLDQLLERRPRQLSGGQRQRVAMGRAMVRHPRVFLMDEPLSNLDARLRTQIRAEIAKLHGRLGTTTLYVTHDQVEAMTLGDRIAVLDAGRLQQVGPAQTLYDRPANAFVAAFLGNPGMNLIAARADRDAGTLRLGDYGWRIPLERLPAGPRAELDREALLLGLRPEAFSPRSVLNAEVLVESVEPLGHERLVYCQPLASTPDSGQPPLVARLAGPPAEAPGQVVELGIDPQRLHFFSAQGAAIV